MEDTPNDTPTARGRCDDHQAIIPGQQELMCAVSQVANYESLKWLLSIHGLLEDGCSNPNVGALSHVAWFVDL